MRYKSAALFGTALLWLVGGARARADHIDWFYSWSNRPSQVDADGSTTTYITLSDEAQTHASGTTDVVATNLNTFSDATDDQPANFTNKSYTLTLTIQDGDTGATNSANPLSFTGQFNGQLTSDASNITNTFTGPTKQSVVLGKHLYTVTVDAYAPPGPPGSSNAGAIGARALVTVQTLPEPASVVLAALAFPAAAMCWRRRRRCGG